MTPEEIAQKTFDSWLEDSRGSLVIVKGEKLKAAIAKVITQAKQAAYEECAKIAEDSDYIVTGRGYYDQLGDAHETQQNIAQAIRKLARGES